MAPGELEHLVRGHWEGNEWVPPKFEGERLARMEILLKTVRDPARQGTKWERERVLNAFLRENHAEVSRWLVTGQRTGVPR